MLFEYWTIDCHHCCVESCTVYMPWNLMITALTNYSLSVKRKSKKSGVRHWGRKLKDQRSWWAATSYLLPLLFLFRNGSRSSLSPAILLPVFYLFPVLQTSIANFDQQVASSVLWLQSSFFVRTQSKYHTAFLPFCLKKGKIFN